MSILALHIDEPTRLSESKQGRVFLAQTPEGFGTKSGCGWMTIRSEVRFGLWELRRPVFDDILADQCRSAGTFAWLHQRAHETPIGLGLFAKSYQIRYQDL